jgi:hypothetical protein
VDDSEAPTIWTKVNSLLKEHGLLVELGSAIEREVLSTLASATMMAGVSDESGRSQGIDKVIEAKGFAMGMRRVEDLLVMSGERQAEAEAIAAKDLTTNDLVNIIAGRSGAGVVAATSRG